jgi:hypothetical protein
MAIRCYKYYLEILNKQNEITETTKSLQTEQFGGFCVSINPGLHCGEIYPHNFIPLH